MYLLLRKVHRYCNVSCLTIRSVCGHQKGKSYKTTAIRCQNKSSFNYFGLIKLPNRNGCCHRNITHQFTIANKNTKYFGSPQRHLWRTVQTIPTPLLSYQLMWINTHSYQANCQRPYFINLYLKITH